MSLMRDFQVRHGWLVQPVAEKVFFWLAHRKPEKKQIDVKKKPSTGCWLATDRPRQVQATPSRGNHRTEEDWAVGGRFNRSLSPESWPTKGKVDEKPWCWLKVDISSWSTTVKLGIDLCDIPWLGLQTLDSYRVGIQKLLISWTEVGIIMINGSNLRESWNHRPWVRFHIITPRIHVNSQISNNGPNRCSNHWQNDISYINSVDYPSLFWKTKSYLKYPTKVSATSP